MTLSRAGLFEKCAIASEQPLASLAGYQILREGGNAFDAAAAVAFALAVTFHPAGGMGGDFFAMVHESKSGKIHCLNSSGWSPSGLTRELLASKGARSVPLFGPLPVVVPGFVAGVLELQGRFGRLELGRLLAPALAYARDGFPMGEGLCKSVAATIADLPGEAKEIFAPGGRLPVPGAWVRQAELGKVIQAVSEGGADAFYRGWPAEKISETLTGLGVRTTMDDMDFKPEWVEPLSADYKGTTVYEVPPNSMGATGLLMLKFLSEEGSGAAPPASRERMQTMMKAAALAYGRKDRMLGDQRFYHFDFGEFMDLKAGGAQGGTGRLRGGDTTAFSVADGEGNVVSGIQSLFHHFGSRVFVKDCGIMMSNRGAGFGTEGPNAVGPRKRPLHTLSAALLKTGDEAPLAMGVSGGEYRPMQHALLVTNMVDHSMRLEESVDYPRFLWSGGREIIAEAGLPTSVDGYDVEALRYPDRTGVCHAVQTLPRAKKAVCDVRGDGVPVGY